ncbi:MAG: putative transaldolase [Parcubacteria group bacterium GW2011_GWF2_45_11]|nr:MAG: putative transaldolase [Parcubacteria group bacterium GW2011_GWF2_45_11]OGY93496.1 MAG: fructose-6-phosphate aldolase [Candidatus Komeilibacteria bacterium RIFOXYC2_FULL_45_12]HBR13489.1 fructose-6-phosphate aldolase [Candidatus Komeilibacteria bacterium]
MKLFIDSGNVEEIKKAYAVGVIDGVTTNPSLIAKEGRDFMTVLKEIIEIFENRKDVSISAEVTSTEVQGMLAEAKPLAKLHPSITIKVPITPSGIKALKEMFKLGYKTNATLCFSASQALLAAKAGATYVSPFLGRLDDIGENSQKLLKEIRSIYDIYELETQILAASIRSHRQVIDCALVGADAVTMPYKIFEQLFQHPQTDQGLKKFLADWQTHNSRG